MEHDQAFAAFVIRYAGDDKSLFRGSCDLMQLLFDPNVRDHLTGNLAEATQPVGNFDESLLLHCPHISPPLPPLTAHFPPLPRPAHPPPPPPPPPHPPPPP